MAQLHRASILRRAREQLRAGRLRQTHDCCRKLLDRQPDDVEAMSLLARVALRGEALQEAERLLRRCTELESRNADHHVLLALVLTRQGRHESALERYDVAATLAPTDMRVPAGRATVHELLGNPAQGVAELRPIIDASSDNAEIACQYVRMQTTLEQLEPAIEVARRALGRPDVGDPQRSDLLFALGKTLERSGRSDEAFEAYAEANRLLPRLDFDLDEALRWDARLTEVHSASALAALPRAGRTGTTLVFIVGMPRSGTTLTESIIDSHPAVRGIGESMAMTGLVRGLGLTIGSTLGFPECVIDLEQSDVDTVAATFVERLRGRFVPEEPSITTLADKTLDTHRYLGLISLLLPDARVIWVRRDPVDTCFGCFSEPLAARVHPYASDLRSLGLMHRMHERLMEHWRAASDLPIMELHYEQLVTAPEPTTRALVDFCGLPWDDACLRHHDRERHAATLSHQQVRTPIYTSSVRRAAAFEHHLDALRAGLDEGRAGGDA